MKAWHMLLFTILAACGEVHDYTYRKLDIKGLPDNVTAVASGDLTGGRMDELILLEDTVVRIYQIPGDSARLIDSIPLPGNQAILRTGDADGDRQADLVVLAGWKRKTNVPVILWRIRDREGRFIAEELYRSITSRPQPVSLLITDLDDDGNPEILASWFESKYHVRTILCSFTNGKWAVEDFAVERMAMTRDAGRMGGSDSLHYLVGRVYGDTIGLDGDAWIGRNREVMLPVRRGVKVIRLGDADNSGENEIYVADGWHFDYGKIARGRIAAIWPEKDIYRYELIEDVKYQYEVSQIEIADVTGDRRNELLTHGNRFFRMYSIESGQWMVFGDTLIPPADFAIGNITGDRHPEVIFTGNVPEVWQFSNPVYTSELGEEVLTEMRDPGSLVGMPAPELGIQAWLNGTFSGIGNNRGRVLLLDFWATWCGPCIRSFPMMKEYQEKYGPLGLQVLGLTRIDDRQSRRDIEMFTEKQQFIYPIGLSVESHNNLAYGVGGIPHTVLIDRQGIVRHYQVGTGNEKELEKKILELLKED